jgi:hypothetical protein
MVMLSNFYILTEICSPDWFHLVIRIFLGYQDTYDVLPESLVKKAPMPRERNLYQKLYF